MTSKAALFCDCGMSVELHHGSHGWWWRLWDPDDPPETLPPGEVVVDEVRREKAAAASFRRSIRCRCDRRYRADLDPPAIVEEGNGSENGS